MFRRIQALFGRESIPPKPPPELSRSDTNQRPSAAGSPVDVTDATFDGLALSSGPLTVVDFWADWCQPCQVMSAHVEMLARDYGSRLRVLALDVDENPRTSERYQVMGLPTLIFFHQGVEVQRIVGVGSYDALRRETERLLSASTEPHP